MRVMLRMERHMERARSVRVWWHRWQLDHELADGRTPGSDGLLALRAGQIVSRRHRSTLAKSLRTLIDDAQRHAARPSPVPLCRRTVRQWREPLLGLADRMADDTPISPCGVARVTLLLTDGRGPLYNPEPARSLPDTIWWIADGLSLDPCDGPGGSATSTVDSDLTRGA